MMNKVNTKIGSTCCTDLLFRGVDNDQTAHTQRKCCHIHTFKLQPFGLYKVHIVLTSFVTSKSVTLLK